MKKFILKVLLAVVLIITTLGAYFIGQYFIGVQKGSSFGPELYYALDLAEEKTEYTEVIIGDSVARLIFSPEYQSETDKICYLATNQAITTLGNYILLSRYLENNPQTKKVLYIVRPQSLANPLWFNYSYQYFIIPFYNDKYMHYIDIEDRNYIENRFGKLYSTNALVKSFIENNSYYMDVYLNNVLEQQLENRNEKVISDLAVKYLKKISELCENGNIEFQVMAAPLPDTEINKDWSEFEKKVLESGLSKILAGYIDGIDYYNEEFFSDEAHFTQEYLKKNRQYIIDELFKTR